MGDYWASPELAVALIAKETSTLNVGTAGMLMRSHNALRVGSTFSFLEHNFPGRIDFGMARGTPTSDGNRKLLCDIDDGDVAFERNVRLVVQLLHDAQSLLPDTFVLPQPAAAPRIWMLGSSTGMSQKLAAELSLRYVHAYFFRNSSPPNRDGPLDGVALAGLCSDDSMTIDAFLRNYKGPFKATVVGCPEKCAQLLIQASKHFSVDSITFLDLEPSPQGRLKTVAALAEALDKVR